MDAIHTLNIFDRLTTYLSSSHGWAVAVSLRGGEASASFAGIQGAWSGETPLFSLPYSLFVSLNVFSVLMVGLLGFQIARGLHNNWNARPGRSAGNEQTSLRKERSRVQALYNLVACLGSTLNYQRVLETIVELSEQALSESAEPSSQLISSVLLFDDDVLKVAAARGLSPADLRAALPAKSGILAQSLADGTPCLVRSPVHDPELRRLVALHACQSVMLLPLRTGRDVYGLLLYAHPDPNYFTSDRKEILEVINQQAVAAIQNARLYQALEREKERIVEIQEEARKQLARDLHDGPTQIVAAIAMRAGIAQKMLDRDPREAREELVQIEAMARRTTHEIRHMLFTLRPLVLESEGLAAALNLMAQKVRETFGQNVLVEIDPRPIEKLDLNKQGVIFYLAEEAVTNARKHAQAAHIWVRLRALPSAPDLALLEIQDDGVGFELSGVNGNYERSGSLGMVNLRERSELINGLLNIESTPGRGTRIQVAIPLSEAAAEALRTA